MRRVPSGGISFYRWAIKCVNVQIYLCNPNSIFFLSLIFQVRGCRRRESDLAFAEIFPSRQKSSHVSIAKAYLLCCVFCCSLTWIYETIGLERYLFSIHGNWKTVTYIHLQIVWKKEKIPRFFRKILSLLWLLIKKKL